MHVNDLKKLLSPQKITCSECKEELSNQNEVKQHLSIHTNQRRLAKVIKETEYWNNKIQEEAKPEPDNNLVNLLEAMEEVVYDDKNKSS